MAAPLRMMEMVLLVVLVTAFTTRVTAQSSCTNVIMGMAPCLTYITGNSSTPSSSCCLAINRTLALALPSACNVQTPSVDRCNAANGPASPPTNSPVASLSPADSPTDTSESETPTSTISPAVSESSHEFILFIFFFLIICL
ncbi:hypothetical protein MKW92_002455 [Papaver armeniacum]|nr:hypothetical protein MKW92_002455 [Papaver armeniacum]